VDVISVTPTAALVKCFRCAGDECPKCNGTGYRERKRCEKCGEPSGRISEGLRQLVGLKNGRDGGPFYHVGCHPNLGHVGSAALDLMASGTRVGV
jgi:hypothetical protein